ncbi:MAG: Ig-like domain-containing protein, partial [Campylobacterota bacterium]|nr:Ig-like domain-containing protein [Campylobacterota bacterium]
SDFNGTDSFTYTITDADGDTSIATVTIKGLSGDGVVAQDDNETTDIDTPVSISVLDNDYDLEGDMMIEVDFVGNPANGTVTWDRNGMVTYTPNSGFTGIDSFEYTIVDENGNIDRAVVTVIIKDESVTVENSVAAIADSANTPFNIDVMIPVLNNDYDIEGDIFNITDFNTMTANGGTITQYGDILIYTPRVDFNGTDQFSYEITDAYGATDIAIVTVTVLAPGADGVPNAVGDGVTTQKDTPIDIAVMDNDNHTSGDSIKVVATTTPANGSVRINSNATVTYTPNSGFSGIDTFVYTIEDSNGDQATAIVTVIIDDPNSVTARPDSSMTSYNTPIAIDVMRNDFDAQGDSFTISSFDTIASNGGTIRLENGKLIYTPKSGFSGIDTFNYEITDSNGAVDTTIVTITVTIINTPVYVPTPIPTPTPTPTLPPLELRGDLSIGNLVWFDENRNGLQDDDEQGVAGITVELHNETGDIIATTITDSNGEYLFRNVAVGNYRIVFSQLPSAYSFTTPGVGMSHEVDSNSDGIGVVNGISVISNDYTIDVGIHIESGESRVTQPVFGSCGISAVDDYVIGHYDEVATIDVIANDLKREQHDTIKLQLLNEDHEAVEIIEVNNEGTWLVENGKILFMPIDGFRGKAAPVEYQSSECESAKAWIYLAIDELLTIDDNATTSSGKAVSLDILDNDRGSIDIVQTQLGIADDLALLDAIVSEDKKRVTVPNEGIWELDENGIVTFSPDRACKTSPTPILYSAFTSDGKFSSTATISVVFEESLSLSSSDEDGESDSASSLTFISFMLIVMAMPIIALRRRKNRL